MKEKEYKQIVELLEKRIKKSPHKYCFNVNTYGDHDSRCQYACMDCGLNMAFDPIHRDVLHGWKISGYDSLKKYEDKLKCWICK